MPTLALGVADRYDPIDEGWGPRPVPPVEGASDFAWHLADRMVGDHFDPMICRELAVDHGRQVPMALVFGRPAAPQRYRDMTREDYVEVFGSEGAELIMWLVMRGLHGRPGDDAAPPRLHAGLDDRRGHGAAGERRMCFRMVCPHHPDAEVAARRDALLPEHRAWVASGGNGPARVLTGSALWNDAGEGIGNFGILEARDEAAARAFAEGDPLARGGVVSRIELTRLAGTFQAGRVQPLTAG